MFGVMKMMYKEPVSWGYVFVLVSLIIISIIAWAVALMPVYDEVSGDLTVNQTNEINISNTYIVVQHPRVIRDNFYLHNNNSVGYG